MVEPATSLQSMPGRGPFVFGPATEGTLALRQRPRRAVTEVGLGAVKACCNQRGHVAVAAVFA